MLVAHLADIRPVEEVEISVAAVTHAGLRTSPVAAEYVEIEIVHGYVLVTLRQFPFVEDGTYRFLVALRGAPVVDVGIPVIAPTHCATAAVH